MTGIFTTQIKEQRLREKKMPNYCNNLLIIKGRPEDLDKFKEQYKNSVKYHDGKEETLWIDFRKVNPDKNYKDEEIEKFNANPELVKRYEGSFYEYWHDNHDYNYRAEEWGQKWNYNGEEPAISNDKKRLVYRFDTAWSPAIPIIITLIGRHRELDFDYSYDEPGMAFGGKIKSEQGEIIEEEEYNITTGICPECDSWNIKPDYENKYECDCGNIFSQEEAKKDD